MNLQKVADHVFDDAITFVTRQKCTANTLRRYIGDKIRSRGLRLSFPVCISLDNYIGGHCDDVVITQDHLLKIEFGLRSQSETFYFGKTRGCNELEEIYKDIIAKKETFECTDDIRLFIEGACAERHLTPIKNTLSIQENDHEGGYFYLNYSNEDDSDVWENLNFDIQHGDRYIINMTVTKDEGNLKISKENGNIFKISPYGDNRLLKLKSAKTLFSIVKRQFGDDAFDFNLLDFTGTNLSHLGAKMGLRECLEKEVFIEYPVSWVKSGSPVYFKKFTITF